MSGAATVRAARAEPREPRGARLADFPYFLRVAERLAWDEQEIDLAPDRAAWPCLADADRRAVLGFVAAFHVAEAEVAEHLEPFTAAAGPGAAACFAAQAADERRHARFFDRWALEVAAVPGGSPQARRRALRLEVPQPFLDLFEQRLSATARALAAGRADLGSAVGLYHMILEGVVFNAGQRALLALLERLDRLPGLRAGLQRIVDDERWHIGFGARCLQETGLEEAALERLLAEGEAAAGLWPPTVLGPREARRSAALHRRRLGAAGLISTSR